MYTELFKELSNIVQNSVEFISNIPDDYTDLPVYHKDVSGDNHCHLSALPMGIEPLEYTPCHLLDGRIPVRDWTWGAVCYLS